MFFAVYMSIIAVCVGLVTYILSGSWWAFGAAYLATLVVLIWTGVNDE